MIWKEIGGYRFAYRINEDGAVQRGMEDGTWRDVKPYLAKGGGGSAGNCLFVKLAVFPSGHKRVQVARLMEGRFIRPRRPGEITSYRNRLPADCSRWNLYQTTRAQVNARVGGGMRKSVEKVAPDGSVLELYGSVEEAARKNFASRGCIYRRCMGKTKSLLGGATFRYENGRSAGAARRRAGGGSHGIL